MCLIRYGVIRDFFCSAAVQVAGRKKFEYHQDLQHAIACLVPIKRTPSVDVVHSLAPTIHARQIREDSAPSRV